MERNKKSVQREIPTFLSAMFDSGNVKQQKFPTAVQLEIILCDDFQANGQF